MEGQNINYVKLNILNAIDVLKDKSPDSKVAIVTFESNCWYYGDSFDMSSKVQTITKSDFQNNTANLQAQANQLRPITEAYDSLKTLVESLQATGGTMICDALAHCAVLGSTFKNSEIILCTDGATSDTDEIYFNQVAEYAKRNLTKFHIVRLANSNLDLEKFACLQRETGGSIFDSSLKFDFLIDEVLKERIFTGYTLSLMTHSCIELYYEGKNCYNHIDLNLDKLERDQKVLLVEFRIKQSYFSQNNVYQRRNESSFFQVLFQLKLSASISKRILTHSIDVRKDASFLINERIIHVNSLKKLRFEFWNEKKREAQVASSGNLKNVKKSALAYEEFLKKFKMNEEVSKRTVEFLKKANLADKIDDETTAFLSNSDFPTGKEYFLTSPEVIVPKKEKPQWKTQTVSTFDETKKLLSRRPTNKVDNETKFNGLRLQPMQSNDHLLQRVKPSPSSLSMSSTAPSLPKGYIRGLDSIDDAKLIIQTSLDLPPLNDPVTRFFKKQNNNLIELNANETHRENMKYKLFSNELKNPINLLSDIKINKAKVNPMKKGIHLFY
jgi:hypothetical protein